MRFKDNKAIYLQIADLICDEILQQKLLEDERIPSVREYAAIVEVNANTCARAYDWLQGLHKTWTGLFRLCRGKRRHPPDEAPRVHDRHPARSGTPNGESRHHHGRVK